MFYKVFSSKNRATDHVFKEYMSFLAVKKERNEEQLLPHSFIYKSL